MNPYDVEAQAVALYRALTLGEAERRRRLEAIREHVREHDVNAWIERQLAVLDAIGASARR